MKLFKAALLFLLTLGSIGIGLTNHSYAETKTDWKPEPANLIGLDGVGIRCVVSSDRKFVHQMCKTFIKAATEKATAIGLKSASVGISWERNPDDAYTSAIAAAEIFSPMLLEFFIRGTDGSPVSGAIHILASVEYKAAVEEGAKNPQPRTGRLVIWENAGTASGEAKKLAGVLANHMAKKLDLLFGAF